jgi:hypothetical protein
LAAGDQTGGEGNDWWKLVVGACVGVGVAAIIAIAAFVLLRRTPDRYHFEHVKRGLQTELVRIDRQTGKTEIFDEERGWHEPEKWQPPVIDLEEPQQPKVSPLDAQELAALSATVDLEAQSEYPSGEPLLLMHLHNGGARRVLPVVTRVVATDQAGRNALDRQYEFTLYESPDPFARMVRHHGDVPGCEPRSGATFSAAVGFPRNNSYRFACQMLSGGGIAR